MSRGRAKVAAMRLATSLLALALVLGSAAAARADGPRVGPIQERLGDDVLVNLPAGYQVSDAGPGRLRIEPRAPSAGIAAPWSVEVTRLATGHVIDGGRLDAEALLAQLAPQGRCRSWRLPPRYDTTRRALAWELTCDGDPAPLVELHLRVLGRQGVVALDARVPADRAAEARLQLLSLRMALPFADGARYEDYQPGRDPVAPGGLSALIAPGAVPGSTADRLPVGRALAGAAAILVLALFALGRRRRAR